MEKKKKKNKLLIALVVVLILVIALAAAGYALAPDILGSPADPGNDEKVVVVIPEGSGTAKVASILSDKNIIKSDTGFRIVSKIKKYDGQIKAGVYSFSPSMDAVEILETLKTGKGREVKFTVPEGYTQKQIAEKIENEGLGTASEFLKECQSGTFDYQFIQYLPKNENRLEGVLYPETYYIPEGADEHQIIDTMLKQFNDIFTDEDYKIAEKGGRTFLDIITVASIVEKETVLDEDRANVASVLYNRLAKKMKLQCDTTVLYALGVHKKQVLYKDLEIDSPYNTYKVAGLPAGPICSPGKASIDAALYPAKTKYIYFILEKYGQSKIVFFSDYQKFLKAKEVYLKSAGDGN